MFQFYIYNKSRTIVYVSLFPMGVGLQVNIIHGSNNSLNTFTGLLENGYDILLD